MWCPHVAFPRGVDMEREAETQIHRERERERERERDLYFSHKGRQSYHPPIHPKTLLNLNYLKALSLYRVTLEFGLQHMAWGGGHHSVHSTCKIGEIRTSWDPYT